MLKKYKCLNCNSIIEVEFTEDISTKRTFFDGYSVNKLLESSYLWGNTHSCPLLSTNKKSQFDILIQEGKVEEIV